MCTLSVQWQCCGNIALEADAYLGKVTVTVVLKSGIVNIMDKDKIHCCFNK